MMCKSPLALELKGFLGCAAPNPQQRDIFLLQMEVTTKKYNCQNAVSMWLWSAHAQMGDM